MKCALCRRGCTGFCRFGEDRAAVCYRCGREAHARVLGVATGFLFGFPGPAGRRGRAGLRGLRHPRRERAGTVFGVRKIRGRRLRAGRAT